MLRRSVRLLLYNEDRPDPARFHCIVGRDQVTGHSPNPNMFDYTDAQLSSSMPAFSREEVNNNYVFNMVRHSPKHKSNPLKQKMSCPWCSQKFDFTYEEYRRDDSLKEQYKAHEDSHTPPPGWEPDPRPMKGKGVTKYDHRHRFGWMLGEEW